EADGRLAAHALGEGALALDIAAGVEPARRAERWARADKIGVGFGEKADMDVVTDIAWSLHAGGFTGEPRPHQIRGEAGLLVGAERVRDHELLEGEPFAVGVELAGGRGQRL